MNTRCHGFMKPHAMAGLLVLLSLSGPLHAGEPHAPAAHSESQAIGASVEELLTVARRMNPELAATALEAEAAAARVEGADALPDPKFQITFDDISKNDAGWPSRTGVYKYTLQQELPGWGKRATKRQIAEAGSREASGQLEERVVEVIMRVKSAYADYHRVHLSMDQTSELIQVLRALVELGRVRYAQGMGLQAEATSAEAERGSLAAELIRLEKERQRIRARLNLLVNRSPDAPLVEHPRLRPIPAESDLDYEKLLQKARLTNPGLKMNQAKLEGADGEVRLADKNWLPDVELGFGLVNRRDEGARDGFEAMVSFNLPIQTGWRSAAEREAAVRKQAASERLNLARLQLESGLREALLNLEESRQVEKTANEVLLPQARIALQSAIKGYESGTSEAVTVLDAVQRLKKFQIERIKARFEQQVRLAEIERLIGGDL